MTDQVLAQWWRRLSYLSSQDSSTADLVLLCGDGERIVCHQLVMGLASPNLSNLIQGNVGEDIVITLPEVDGRVVRSLLAVVYNRYIPTNLKDQQEIDKVAQMLGLRVKHNKSNIVFKCDGEVKEETFEPYLEERTTFLYVDDMKVDEMLTLDESETYEVNVSDNNFEVGGQITSAQPSLEQSHNPIDLDDQSSNNPYNFDVSLVSENKLIIEEADVDEKIIIVPIGSNDQVIHETIEIENTTDKPVVKPKTEIRRLQLQSCCSCNQRIIDHKTKDLVSNKWFYRCCQCNKSNLKSAIACVKHVSSHIETCQLCQHSKLEHRKNKHFFCCQCKKQVLGSKLHSHVEKHTNKNQFICGVGHKEIVCEPSLNEHLKRERETTTLVKETKSIIPNKSPLASTSSTPRLTCPSCSKSMTRRHYNKHHKASCSKERVLKCDICSREGFCNISTLQDHIRAKHTNEKPFKCEYCSKGFPAASHLAHHRMKKHSVNSKGELQPKIVFPCNFCGKVLTTKPKLLAHVKVIHQGIKDFACPTCLKSFSSKSNLDIHIGSVHTGNLPYKCEFCPKSFARKNLLSAHRQTAHQFIEAQSVHSQGSM